MIRARNYLQLVLSSAAQSSDDYGVSQSGYYEIATALKAVNRMIPEPPAKRDLWELGTAEGYACPTCGYEFPVNYFEPCCCKCGQAIGWRH